MEHNAATGFSDSGIYIGAITSTPGGTLTVRSNKTYGNARGIIVEDSACGSIKVSGNQIHGNAVSGIFVTNSGGVKSRATPCRTTARRGIELDPNSDNNLVVGNKVSGHTFDLSNDGGSGNCWRQGVSDQQGADQLLSPGPQARRQAPDPRW